MITWLIIATLLLAAWYIFRKVGDEVFVAIDRRIYPDKVTSA